MSANWGKNIELSIFGESHGKALGIVIGNLPAGVKLDEDFIRAEAARRAPGKNAMSTSRKEADQFEILSGVLDGVTTGAPLCAVIANTSQHSGDYDNLKKLMRPGHSDYPAYVKYHGYNDVRGGGHFSGRLTAPIVFAGAIAKQILKDKGIYIGSHVLSVKDVRDDAMPLHPDKDFLEALAAKEYPVINDEAYEAMKDVIAQARSEMDSVGGKIECVVTGLDAGIGSPFFDSVESHLSSLMFSIPAVKSLSFGDLDDITLGKGSETNDAYAYDRGQIVTTTNHNGGLLGGITTGMPLLFRVGIKPTPSIGKAQNTVNVETQEDAVLEIKGRHDPCIVMRAAVVVEAMAALCVLDEVNV